MKVQGKKTILYIADYINEEIKKERNIEYFFPARNNKVLGIARAIAAAGYDVIILANGWTKGYSGKKFTRREFYLDKQVKLIYAPLKDTRLINIPSTVFNIAAEALTLSNKYNVEAVMFYNYVFNTSVPAFILKVLQGLPLIIDFEESYCLPGKKKFLISLIIEKLGKFMTNGAIISTTLLKKRLPPQIPVCVIRGFYSDTAKIYSKGDFRGNAVMYGGRWDEDRGIDVFLEALGHIRSKTDVIITGYGPLKNMVYDGAEKLKGKGLKVNVFEALDRSMYLQLLYTSRVLVNPQKSGNSFGHASFPSKLYEYMSTGAAVISSDVSDVEAFADGRVFLYRNDDPLALAGMIDYVLENSAIGMQYGLAAVEWVKNTASHSYISSQILEMLEKVKTGRKSL